MYSFNRDVVNASNEQEIASHIAIQMTTSSVESDGSWHARRTKSKRKLLVHCVCIQYVQRALIIHRL